MGKVTSSAELKADIRTQLRAGNHASALELMLQVQPDAELELVQYAGEALARVPPAVISARVPLQKRLAILSGATTQFLAPLIRLFALRRGVDVVLYESDFGLFEQEIWSTSPALKEFAPDMIHFCICAENVGLRDGAETGGAAAIAAAKAGAIPDAIAAEARRFTTLFAAAAERFSCSVVANTFETAAQRPYGSLDNIQPASRNAQIRDLNRAIGASLPPQVYLHDVEALSAEHGKRKWFDPRLWHAAKAAVSFECMPFYADNLAGLVAAAFGKSKKCLVLDLDNTLWGGVIGDDGLGGIQLGAGQPSGEAFQAFQRYVKTLQQRGVLLAVASKNEKENALAPFREHPGMVLKEADISCFIANWERKDKNIQDVAQQLNIGMDSLVFFDDNPVERDLVRQGAPAVTVIDVPEDPAFYVDALHAANLFDTVSITSEDLQRTAFFQGTAGREELEKGADNYDAYLRQLDMRAFVEPIRESNIARTAQLINKTNQFNLTTRRMTEAELREVVADDRSYTSTTRLVDKFGDNGLISVVIGSVLADGALEIDTWLMSCRVLKRGVELLDLERILDFCRSRGISRVRGRYVPTTKNKLVERHFEALGFRAEASEGEGTRWVYDISDSDPSHFITLERSKHA